MAGELLAAFTERQLCTIARRDALDPSLARGSALAAQLPLDMEDLPSHSLFAPVATVLPCGSAVVGGVNTGVVFLVSDRISGTTQWTRVINLSQLPGEGRKLSSYRLISTGQLHESLVLASTSRLSTQ